MANDDYLRDGRKTKEEPIIIGGKELDPQYITEWNLAEEAGVEGCIKGCDPPRNYEIDPILHGPAGDGQKIPGMELMINQQYREFNPLNMLTEPVSSGYLDAATVVIKSTSDK